MQNKKTIIILSIVVMVVGAAAFLGGRMLNGNVGPLGFGIPMGDGGMVSRSVQVTPAPELPTTEPETRGLFAERKDNSIILATISMEAGGGGGIVVERSEDGAVAGSPLDNSGPKVEVVTTGETVIYIETTEFGGPPPSSGETLVIQQTVAEGSLDDLTSQSFVTVWGRKSGDRIIAEVLFISNPVMFKIP